MKVQIEDICPDFFSSWNRARALDLPERRRLWQELYEDRHREIFDIYYRHWGDPARVESALLRFPQAIEGIQECHDGLETRITVVADRCSRIFSVSASPLDFMIMIGCFTSDGWATIYHDKPTIFLALEHVAGVRFLDLLIAHESAHGFHFHCVHEDEWTDFAIDESVFQEGLAVVASIELVPGREEAEYLTLGKPGRREWLAECSATWPELRRRLIGDLSSVDRGLYEVYFGGNPENSELPKRVGYYVGCRAVTHLHRRYTIAEMARWPPDRAADEVKSALEELGD